MRVHAGVRTALTIAALCTATGAFALPITDTVNPTDTLLTFGSIPAPCPVDFVCATSTLSFTHDITDNGFAPGLSITSATLAVHLTDEGGSENYSILIGAGLQSLTVANLGSSNIDTIPLNAAALADLAADGAISVAVRSNAGSFSFAGSVLTAQVAEASASVSEPAPVALLALALTGLGLTRLRFRKV